MDNTNCNICNRKFHNHAMIVECVSCHIRYHLKYITLECEHQAYILFHLLEWICETCNSLIFPFNQLESDNDFLHALNFIDNTAMLNDASLIFNPFELNEIDDVSPLDEIDPDTNFYDSINYQLQSRCTYFNELSFKMEVKTQREAESRVIFSLFHVNIRSVPQNFDNFTNYLNVLDFSFPIIGLTETWLSDSNSDLFSIEGYEFIEWHRQTRSGGGVGILMKNNLNFIYRDDMSHFDEFCESLCVEIDRGDFDMSKNILVAVFYRPPNTDSKVFVEVLNNVLDVVKKEDKLCYMMGDYNINILNYDVHPQTAEFVDLLYSYCFFPLINRPTRVTQSTATVIDNIFTNNLTCTEKSFQGLFVTDISDHYPIFHINWSHQQEDSEIFIMKRRYSYKNKQSFCSDLAKIDWNEIYSLMDAQLIFTRFHEIFLRLHNVNFPKRKIKLKYNNRKPWLTEGLKQSIKNKNKSYMKSVKIRLAYNEMKYKTFRNKLKHVLLTAEKKHYADTLEANKSNMKKTWTILKGIINLNKSKRVQEKFKLQDETITDNKVTISEYFNTFFVNIGPNLAKGMSNQPQIPESFMGNRISNTIFLEPVTNQEI